MAITSSKWWPVAATRRPALSREFQPSHASMAGSTWTCFSAEGERPRFSNAPLNNSLVLKFGNYDKVCGAVFLNTRLPTDRRSRVHAHRTTAAGDCENRNSSRVHHGPDGNNNRRNPTKSNRDSKNGTRNKELPDEVKGPLGTGLLNNFETKRKGKRQRLKPNSE